MFEIVRYPRTVDDTELIPGGKAPAEPQLVVPSSVALPDAKALFACGDRKAAIAALIDAHGDALLGFCVRVLRDSVLAEDVLQQVYFEAYRDIDRFEGRSSFATWLMRIAANRCQDAIRARRRREQRIEPDEQAMIEVIDQSPAVTARLEHARLVMALDDCLELLSDDVRLTVLLRFQSGASYEEMAVSLRVKADALQARVSRALPVLKRCLEGKGWNDE